MEYRSWPECPGKSVAVETLSCSQFQALGMCCGNRVLAAGGHKDCCGLCSSQLFGSQQAGCTSSRRCCPVSVHPDKNVSKPGSLFGVAQHPTWRVSCPGLDAASMVLPLPSQLDPAGHGTSVPLCVRVCAWLGTHLWWQRTLLSGQSLFRSTSPRPMRL